MVSRTRLSYKAQTLLGLRVSQCQTHVGTNMYDYIELCHFLTLLFIIVSVCVRIHASYRLSRKENIIIPYNNTLKKQK
jgi:hypothetical protein